MSERMEDVHKTSYETDNRMTEDFTPSQFLMKYTIDWKKRADKLIVRISTVALLALFLAFLFIIFSILIATGAENYGLSGISKSYMVTTVVSMTLSIVFFAASLLTIQIIPRIFLAYANKANKVCVENDIVLMLLRHDFTYSELKVLCHDVYAILLTGQPVMMEQVSSELAARLRYVAGKLRPSFRMRILAPDSPLSIAAMKLDTRDVVIRINEYIHCSLNRHVVFVCILLVNLLFRSSIGLLVAGIAFALNIFEYSIQFSFDLASVVIVWSISSTVAYIDRYKSLAFEAAFFKVLADYYPWEYEAAVIRSQAPFRHKYSKWEPIPFDIGKVDDED